MIEQNHECYISLEVAKLLKEAGFDWECIRYYQNDDETLYGPLVEQYKLVETNFNVAPIYMNQYSAPTIEVAQRWLREEKSIAVYVCPSYEPERFVAPNIVAEDEKWIMKWQVSATHFDIEHDEINLCDVEEKCFDTYEEAQEAGIKKALELILEKGE